MANTIEDSRDIIVNSLDTIVAEANRVKELTVAMRRGVVQQRRRGRTGRGSSTRYAR